MTTPEDQAYNELNTVVDMLLEADEETREQAFNELPEDQEAIMRQLVEKRQMLNSIFATLGSTTDTPVESIAFVGDDEVTYYNQDGTRETTTDND